MCRAEPGTCGAARDVTPPVMTFVPHASDLGFDWSNSDRFGFRGDMFLVEFGSGEPVTTALQSAPPAGFGVLRLRRFPGGARLDLRGRR